MFKSQISNLNAVEISNLDIAVKGMNEKEKEEKTVLVTAVNISNKTINLLEFIKQML